VSIIAVFINDIGGVIICIPGLGQREFGIETWYMGSLQTEGVGDWETSPNGQGMYEKKGPGVWYPASILSSS